MKMTRSISTLSLLLSTSCSEVLPTLETATLDFDQVSVLPLLEGQTPVVHVAVAGVDGGVTKDIAMLLDSGSALTIMTESAARRAGLEPREFPESWKTIDSGGSEVALTHYARMSRFAVGDLEIRDSFVALHESEVLLTQGLDGIIGQDVLGRIAWLGDMERGRVHLIPPGVDIATHLATEQTLVGDWVYDDLDFRPCPFLRLEVGEAADRGLEIEVDTGATSTSFPGAAIDALGLESIGQSERRGLGSRFQADEYRLEALNLYGLQIGLTVSRSKLDYGLFGMDVLSDLVFVLDAPNRQIWLHHRAD